MGKYDKELIETCQRIAAPGKGILAADESVATIGKRFTPIGVENTQENRRRYREMLFRTPNLGEYISGVICFEETLFEKSPDGTTFTDLLLKQGIVIGIKVDKGQQAIAGGAPEETSTDGLDGLSKRCAEYYKKGARFAKWRAVIVIDEKNGAPTQLAIDEQVRGLARYASICQANGLVPIVEPEVLMDGTHTIEVSAQVTERVWAAQIKALHDHGLLLEGLLLKPNMVRSGEKCAKQASLQEIAVHTVRVMARTIPPAIPGMTFLSGGMSEEDSTLALNAMNLVKAASKGTAPWSLSFSYGRALQVTVIKTWAGKDANIQAAQNALLARAKANSEAQRGAYKGGVGGDAAKQSNFEAKYKY